VQLIFHLNGEEYEILKTVKNTVIKKSSENNEGTPQTAHRYDHPIAKKDAEFACDVTTHTNSV